MQHLPIWYMGQIPPEVCDSAVKEFARIEPRQASMGQANELKDSSKRDTVVRFAPENHWFGGVMYQHAIFANKEAKWDYEITTHEAVQFGTYGVNGHYGWHTDTFLLSGMPTERKISVICLMSDPAHYEGGELEIRFLQDYKVDLQKGQIIAFPSILEHRVTPVIAGTRTSAVMWLSGPRMK